jgi:hypothetical protein
MVSEKELVAEAEERVRRDPRVAQAVEEFVKGVQERHPQATREGILGGMMLHGWVPEDLLGPPIPLSARGPWTPRPPDCGLRPGDIGRDGKIIKEKG